MRASAGTYDVMRALNLKRLPELSPERKAAVQEILNEHTA